MHLHRWPTPPWDTLPLAEAMPDFPTTEMALTTILVVGDISESKAWYLDVLGADFFGEYGGTSVVVQFSGAWILLVTGGEPTPDKPSTTFAPPSDPSVVDHSFTIRVPDCEEAYTTLMERGATFLTPPLEQGMETRCFFSDPDGHLFEISSIAK